MKDPADDLSPSVPQITQLLQSAAAGDAEAVGQLAEQIYAELHNVAAALMRRERPGHTLQATALLHEAMLRLLGQGLDGMPNRASLYAVATNTMRQVLVDHARRRKAAKRGGNWQRSPLDDAVAAFEQEELDLDLLGAALTVLEQLDRRQHTMINLRYFGGMPVAEIANMLGVSKSTVEKDLLKARAFLFGQINP